MFSCVWLWLVCGSMSSWMVLLALEQSRYCWWNHPMEYMTINIMDPQLAGFVSLELWYSSENLKYDKHCSGLKTWIFKRENHYMTTWSLYSPSVKNHHEYHPIFILQLSMIGVIYTHIQNRNSDCTAVSVGHTNTHRYGENYFLYWWYKMSAYQL